LKTKIFHLKNAPAYCSAGVVVVNSEVVGFVAFSRPFEGHSEEHQLSRRSAATAQASPAKPEPGFSGKLPVPGRRRLSGISRNAAAVLPGAVGLTVASVSPAADSDQVSHCVVFPPPPPAPFPVILSRLTWMC
jgi:hypothetical protein